MKLVAAVVGVLVVVFGEAATRTIDLAMTKEKSRSCSALTKPEDDIPCELSVEGSLITSVADRVLGDGGELHGELVADFLSYTATPTVPTPTVRRDPEPITLSLAAELIPLLTVLNEPFSPRRPFVILPAPRHVLPDVSRGRRTRIYPFSVDLELDVHDFPGERVNARRQMLWTFMSTACRGINAISPRPPTRADHLLGTLRAPIRFGVRVEMHRFGMGEPIWEHHRLVAVCDEGDRIKAIRNQVSLLSAHLAEPANILPLSHHSMMV